MNSVPAGRTTPRWVRGVVQRLLAFAVTLVLAAFIAFSLQHLVPGDAARGIAGDSATAEQVAEIRTELGLDRPFIEQFANWLAGAASGDLGTSLTTEEPVALMIGQRASATVTIGVGALIVSLLIGIPGGIWAARRQGRFSDAAVSAVTTLGIAVPNFWLGMLLILFFSLHLGWFPATGLVPIGEDPIEGIRSAVLPAVTLGVVGAAEVCRQLRSAMVGVLATDFVRTHRAKGLAESAVVWKHALRNTGLPLATIVGLLLNRIVGATVVIEAVFGIAGIGSLVVTATQQKDYPVVQGVVLITAVVVLLTNLVVDLSYRLIDPRTRR